MVMRNKVTPLYSCYILSRSYVWFALRYPLLCCVLSGNDIHSFLLLAAAPTVTCTACLNPWSSETPRLPSCGLFILPMARRYSSFLLSSSRSPFRLKITKDELFPFKVVKYSFWPRPTVSNANCLSIDLAGVSHGWGP